jgi:hypothetical protein
MDLDRPLIIDPYVGVGPIRIGMTAEEVTNLLGPPHHTTDKASLVCLCYFDSAVQVALKDPGVCEAVEVWGPPAQVSLKSELLIGRRFHEIRRWFRKLDPSVAVTSTGLKSFEYGVALYARDALGSPRDPVESVLVFERDYYEA